VDIAFKNHGDEIKDDDLEEQKLIKDIKYRSSNFFFSFFFSLERSCSGQIRPEKRNEVKI